MLLINRSFWPKYGAVGDGLLMVAEKLSKTHSVGVAFEKVDIFDSALKCKGRGEGVRFFSVPHRWKSSASFILRIVGMVLFLLHVVLVLLKTRPRKVYIATDPPIIIPFFITIYSALFSAKFIYHVQDIHPEATDIVKRLPRFLFRFLRFIDNLSLRKADIVLTLNSTMQDSIVNFSGRTKPVVLLDNPGVIPENMVMNEKKKLGISFCGNAGRLQIIPLVVNSINEYILRNGILTFDLAGSGVYAHLFEKLAKKFPAQVFYRGLVSPRKAQQITSQYNWALLPIHDSVTKLAFPSKASSYLLSGTNILAICSKGTSVSVWIEELGVGMSVLPEQETIIGALFQIEVMDNLNRKIIGKEMIERFSPSFFADTIVQNMVEF